MFDGGAEQQNAGDCRDERDLMSGHLHGGE
jgi:hypothetical protein